MISTARAKTDLGGQNQYGQQVIHKIVLTEETIPQDHRELMSLIAGQGQTTHSNSTLATPQVHSDSCADNFASNQCNLDETQVHQSVTGNYVLKCVTATVYMNHLPYTHHKWTLCNLIPHGHQVLQNEGESTLHAVTQ